MARNILIYSDGTGQAGGLTPDQEVTNVYKLYRATRCGPDSRIDPARQLAFYDPGLGSKADGFGVRFGPWRRLRNVLAQATGLGITDNIMDCYAALVRLWEPGDRIYLVGFSRGAYTVRCLGGVLARCGLPTRMADGSPLRRDPSSAREIARRAVRRVYQHAPGVTKGPKVKERERLAAEFRHDHASDDGTGGPNASPYFIGVFDTVGALANRNFFKLAGGFAALAAAFALVAAALPNGPPEGLFKAAAWVTAAVFAVTLTLGLIARLAPDGDRWRRRLAKIPMLTPFTFYDMTLNDRVTFARHAMAIDENRRDFPPAAWERGSREGPQAVGEPPRVVQLWFAGVHSDIGGSYAENESRLSDVALGWMLEQMAALPHPVDIEEGRPHVSPSPVGMQHDEIKSGSRLLGWQYGGRTLNPTDALHPSVLDRFAADAVLHYDVTVPYRPPGLAGHPDVAAYYAHPATARPQ